jgi:hypothetical protein
MGAVSMHRIALIFSAKFVPPTVKPRLTIRQISPAFDFKGKFARSEFFASSDYRCRLVDS